MVCVIGGGKLGSAIVDGLLKADPSSDISIVERDSQARDALANRFPSARILESPEASDGVVLVVKPNDIPAAAQSVAAVGATRVLSVAAGVTRATLKENLGDGVAVIRAMPNLAAQVQSSATGFCVDEEVKDEDVDWARSILECLGVVVQVDESQIDAVTGVSGSGIAFVLLMMESLIDAGVAAGLDREAAFQLAHATFSGAAWVVSRPDDPAEIGKRVATPGGTTVEGLAVLDQRDIRGAIKDAVLAATNKSRALGNS